MDQVNAFNVKGVTFIDEPPQNDLQILQLLSAV